MIASIIPSSGFIVIYPRAIIFRVSWNIARSLLLLAWQSYSAMRILCKLLHGSEK